MVMNAGEASPSKSPDPSDPIRSRAIKIVRFLKGVTQLSQTVKRQVDEYEQCLWFVDVPVEPGCYTKGTAKQDDHPADLWLQVRRQPEPKVPSPPEDIRSWTIEETLGDSSRQPQLRAEIVRQRAPLPGEVDPPPPEVLRLENHPEIAPRWARYLSQQWERWAELHRRWRRVHEVYSTLFLIYQSLAKQGEDLELVVGVGLLSWRTPQGQTIRRHLLTSRVTLRFQAEIGVFTIEVPPGGAKLQLELDMLDADQAPTSDERSQIESLLEKTENDPWDRATIEPVLKSLAHSLDEKGMFDISMRASSPGNDSPIVSFAPALLLRKRSTRGFLDVLSKVLAQLEGGAPIPACMALMSGADEAIGGQGPSGDRDPEAEKPIYFPLPANDDQLEIIRKLQVKSGVHVQGPPGTGKSHTIANLICHLLALGKRVLITAQTPRALKVLHEKIPEAVQPLCVSLLGNDKPAFDQLERCIREIVARKESFRQGDYGERIRDYESRLDGLKKQEAELRRRLKALRERETLEHIVADGHYRGTAAAIATRISVEAEKLDWLKDSVGHDESAPITNFEATELLELLRKLAPVDASDIAKHAPSPVEVRSIVAKARELASALALSDETLRREMTTVRTEVASKAAAMSSDELGSLDSAVASYESVLSQVLARPDAWIREAIRDVVAGRGAEWHSLYDACRSQSGELVAAAKRREAVRISLPSDIDPLRANADAQALRAFLVEKKSIGVVARNFNPIVKRTKYIWSSATIDGVVCDNLNAIEILIECLTTERIVDDLWRLWSTHATKPTGTLLRQAAAIVELIEILAAILRLPLLRHECARATVGAGLPRIEWDNAAHLQAFAKELRVAKVMQESFRVGRGLEAVLSPLRELSARSNVHPMTRRLLAKLEQRDWPGAAAEQDEAERLEQVRMWLERSNQLGKRLRDKAPILADAIKKTPAAAEWDSHLSSLESAWIRARAIDWYERTFNSTSEQSCEEELHSIVIRKGETLALLAADLAWLKCLSRMSTAHRQAFVAWSQAMRSLGKGTGKYAERHRRDAQSRLAQCRDAIPAWIMPLHQVYDSVEPNSGAFDVVIVDEASQCGLDSRILTFFGKKLVVVGDDKQISPEAVGVHREDVFRLAEEHLKASVPHADSFQPERSLFDFADLNFGERIVLREHFRCVPEIIRFSIDLCYRTKPLLPLRQYPPDRLRPVVARRVSGFRSGSGSFVTNEVEADAVINAIRRCIADARYKEKSFGVVSLQGAGQARLIERKLISTVHPREIESRRIICGDAYSFQGDERHVMFLSMVAAPNETIGALTKDADVRRFNVAASRAQDQMWIFHSVDASDLNPQCCRRLLLDYAYQPKEQVFRNLPISEWKRRAERPIREKGTQPAPFESWFELDVFLCLVDRGFRVIPQYEIAGARIDLMVEGLRSRLAVECNGEHWHGPDRWDQDQMRQRRLERCGLRFFTVWESLFRGDPDACLEPLWSRLAEQEIQPLGTGESIKLDMEGYVPPETVDRREDKDGPSIIIRSERIAPSAGDDVDGGSSFVPGETEVSPVDVNTPPSQSGENRRVDASESRATERSSQDSSTEVSDVDLTPPKRTLVQKSSVIVSQPADEVVEATLDKRESAEAEGGVGDDEGDDGVAIDLAASESDAGSSPEIEGAEPYHSWESRTLTDPRVAKPDELVAGLREIITIEGPMLCWRAYEIYARAGGLRRIRSGTQSKFNHAIQRGAKAGLFELSDGYGVQYQLNRFVRIKGTAAVRPRSRGPRKLGEIPPEELSLLMLSIRIKNRPTSRHELFRAVLSALGLVRATEQTIAILEEARCRAKPPIDVE